MTKEEQYFEEIKKYAEVQGVNSEMTLVRNNPKEFYRILRKAFGGQNANTETYGQKIDYKGNQVTPEYFKQLIESLKDPTFRYLPKDDRKKTNISDAPGFGSVRLSPPFEEPTFDRGFSEFLENFANEDDNVVDFGGGISPFLTFYPRGKKKLVDKNGIADAVSPYGIVYEDAEEFMKKPIEPKTILFCFHTLEHMDNPEETIKKFSEADVFVFATPNEEIISTSIYHHIFMQISVFKSLFQDLNKVAFLRRSKVNALDINGIVINSPQKYNQIKDNLFFKKNFRLYTEI